MYWHVLCVLVPYVLFPHCIRLSPCIHVLCLVYSHVSTLCPPVFLSSVWFAPMSLHCVSLSSACLVYSLVSTPCLHLPCLVYSLISTPLPLICPLSGTLPCLYAVSPWAGVQLGLVKIRSLVLVKVCHHLLQVYSTLHYIFTPHTPLRAYLYNMTVSVHLSHQSFLTGSHVVLIAL